MDMPKRAVLQTYKLSSVTTSGKTQQSGATEFAGQENAGLENDGQKTAGVENDGQTV